MAESPQVSVILPTLNENLALRLIHDPLLEALSRYRAEVIVVDDASSDGTIPLVEGWAKDGSFRLLERTGRHGLASAVIDGMARAQGQVIVVMDADGSHEPRSIPSLVEPVLEGRAEFVLGSRHVPGGSSPGMGRGRRLVSWGAALLSRPLTAVQDPMSGFFAVARPVVQRARLAPIGYKIGLEILVKCAPDPTLEVPIHFAPRAAGQSKLGGVQIGGYVFHLGRLFLWRLFGPGRPRRVVPRSPPAVVNP
ncbi:MAG: polyprenol monophosphomannose synthase [Thermoplasmata archaeon]|nr:polyprenol monophosphomannose synthase [Thermoplasmata archaeon]